jgi:hypothetical protein
MEDEDEDELDEGQVRVAVSGGSDTIKHDNTRERQIVFFRGRQKGDRCKAGKPAPAD